MSTISLEQTISEIAAHTPSSIRVFETLGIDYWITPSVVLKAAYQIDDKRFGEDQNAYLVQLGIGL